MEGRGFERIEGVGETYSADDGIVVRQMGFAVLAAEDTVGV